MYAANLIISGCDRLFKLFKEVVRSNFQHSKRILRKHADTIYNYIFAVVKMKISLEKMILLIFRLKTLIVGTR